MPIETTTRTTITGSEVFQLVAGDTISITKNGTQVASYTVPVNKKAVITLTFNGTEG